MVEGWATTKLISHVPSCKVGSTTSFTLCELHVDGVISQLNVGYQLPNINFSSLTAVAAFVSQNLQFQKEKKSDKAVVKWRQE